MAPSLHPCMGEITPFNRRSLLGAALATCSTPLTAGQTAPPPTPLQVREDPLVLDYYAAPSREDPPELAVLVLGGSEGGLAYSTRNARDLAAAGLPAAALAYFGAPGLPRFLEEVPLEYFSDALDWIETNVRPAKIAVIGHSRGAEAALLLASRDRRVRGLVLFAPVYAVNQSFRWDGAQRSLSAWTHQGRALPFVPTLEGRWEDAATQFRESYAQAGDVSQTRIPAEQVNGPILLHSTSADRICPCSDWSARIVQDLRDRSFPFLVEEHVYPAASHLLMGRGPAPIQIGSGTDIVHFGGTAEGTEAARNAA